MDKIIKNVGMSKTEIVEAMKRFSDIESRKSILGKVNIDTNDITEKVREDFEKASNPKGSKANNLGFFSFDETEYKLKKADWLDAVCFEG